MKNISPDDIRAEQIILGRDREFTWQAGMEKGGDAILGMPENSTYLEQEEARNALPFTPEYVDESMYVLTLPAGRLADKVFKKILAYMDETRTPPLISSLHDQKTMKIMLNENILAAMRESLKARRPG